MIRAVDGSSDAGAKGLQQGDVIVSAANRPVLTLADLEAAVRATQTGSRPALLLRVQRGNQPAGYVPIRLR